MMAKKITVIPGDGIGQEITEETVRVLGKIDEIYKIGFQFEWKEAGGTAYDHTGSPLPEETIESCRKADAVLFGAVGGDQWDHLTPDLRPEKPSWAFGNNSDSTSTSVPSASPTP